MTAAVVTFQEAAVSRCVDSSDSSETPKRVCAAPGCAVTFTPARKAQRYHSATCRQRGARARKAAEALVEQESQAEKDAEHPLVAATHQALDEAGARETMLGQLAMETARRSVNLSAAGYASMSKLLPLQVEAAITAVKPAAPVPAGAVPEAVDDVPDALQLARERRDAARQAAGQA